VTSTLSSSTSCSWWALPAAEVVVGHHVGVEAARAGAFDESEQAGLGQLAERVVHGGAGQLGELQAGLLEDLFGAQVGVGRVGVGSVGEHRVDRPALGGGAQPVSS
jgi:uncharacterized protein YfiM (DUF2279 family)